MRSYGQGKHYLCIALVLWLQVWAILQKGGAMYDALKSIPVDNWFIGRTNALHAWSANATIEVPSQQQRIRRALKKIGYIAHFSKGVLSIVKEH